MAYGQQSIWGPQLKMEDPNKGKAFGAGMGGNSIKAVGGGFKEKNTGKMIAKTGAQILGTIYGGPAGGMAAGMAVDAIAPDKQSVRSGTSGFGSQQGGGGGNNGTSMQQGGSSNMGNLAVLAAQGYDQYQAGQKAAGPLADPATTDALSEVNLDPANSADKAFAPATDAAANTAADGTADAATDGVGNAAMYLKAAVDVSNKLNESGVTASETPGESKFNMDAAAIGSGNEAISLNNTPTTQVPNAGPLNPQAQNKMAFDEEEYMKRFGGSNYVV
jgi:hypothetical protein